jgi:hypothetical protein
VITKGTKNLTAKANRTFGSQAKKVNTRSKKAALISLFALFAFAVNIIIPLCAAVSL